MKLRKLRIAFSATCGIACVLLIVLWVRSNDQYSDPELVKPVWFNNHIYHAFSINGYWALAASPQPGPYTHVLIPEELFGTRYWIPVTACAFLSIMFWIRWPSRFSLRTLLIATTLIAAVLGLIVWAMH